MMQILIVHRIAHESGSTTPAGAFLSRPITPYGEHYSDASPSFCALNHLDFDMNRDNN
jgi:hypothetical protein